MKIFCKKGLRTARIAAAVSAMILAGSSLSGCKDSKNLSNDEVKLEIAEEGDLITGKPYKIRASRHLQDLRAEHGDLTAINPVTGEHAGENEWFYVLPEEYFTSYELNYDSDIDSSDNNGNDGEANSLKAFTETFRATLSDGKTRETQETFAVTDPLFPDEWHLYNIGQNPYGVTAPPLKKIDFNVIPAWRIILPEDKKQIDGSGVYVAVWDQPIDLNHEDLRDRIYDPGIPGTADLINTGLPLEYLQEHSDGYHGTVMAGIIAASAMNKQGGRGVAFNSYLTSFNMNSDHSLSLSAMLKMNRLNLVNASINLPVTYQDPAVWDLYEALYENNIALINSQGNDFENGKLCLSVHTDCTFPQTAVFKRYPFNIHVGALNSLGVKASYGSTGANMWVTGFGGEFGAHASYPEWSYGAAIVTTLTSYDPRDFRDPDEDSPRRTEENKYYTNTMNGTSAATASVSGAAALAYQARPDMTVSELRYLLAKTSRNDTVMPALALSPLEAEDDVYDEKIVFDYGWQDNAAGFRFSNWYGFGVADAEALVKAALECDKDPICSGMRELPEKYVSANENPCAYTDDSKRLITCSFSDFQNEEGKELGRNELIVDALTYDVSGLNYLPEGIIEVCELAASAEDEEKTEHNEDRMGAVHTANAFLELIAESESGTKSLLKPVYANWDYRSGSDIPSYDEHLEPLDIATSAFYQAPLREDPDRKYRLNVRSVCQIDVDKLNKNMHLTVYGRRR